MRRIYERIGQHLKVQDRFSMRDVIALWGISTLASSSGFPL